MMSEFKEHMQSGVTTICRCWAVTRADGAILGFTDHDQDLRFEDYYFRADTGLSARAFEQNTGLSVDNSEALGVLSDSAVREEDLERGLYDDAQVDVWLVNWKNPQARLLKFRGHLGAIRRSGKRFEAELRGLSDRLNRPFGRTYQKSCAAMLGDTACGFNLDTPGFSEIWTLIEMVDNRFLFFEATTVVQLGWFRHGQISVLSGLNTGASALIRDDRLAGGRREIELWQPLSSALKAGDQVRLIAGCDKRFETCGAKFANRVNFQGFPDLPGEDLLVSSVAQAPDKRGGSRR